MTPDVEISPLKDGDGFYLRIGDSTQWFAHEHHALGYAQEMYPEADIVLYGSDGGVRRRYTRREGEQGKRSDSSVAQPSRIPPKQGDG